MNAFGRKLHRELPRWVAQGWLAEGQAEHLRKAYPLDDGQARFFRLGLWVAAALVFAGIALLISANWQDIPDAVKIGGAVLLTAGMLGGGYRARFAARPRLVLGEVLLVLGCLFVLATLALISQTFHLTWRTDRQLLLWLVLIAPVPWVARSAGAQWAVTAALLATLVAAWNEPLSWLWLETGVRGGWIRPVALAALTGVALWQAGLCLERTRWNHVAGGLKWPGLLAAAGCWFALSFTREATVLRGVGELRALVPLLAVAVTLAAGWAADWRRPGRRLQYAPTVAGVFLLILAGAALPGWEGGTTSWWYAATTCAGLFVFGGLLVRDGVFTGREGWINLGLGLIFVNLFARYWDLFGGMLESGIFYLVTGLVLAAGILVMERQRRRYRQRMQTGGAA
ncbi:MAG: DUF2157 domain-containing protein [Puniceicoccaceae bacterium]|nr:MAG: DUF2157 domain-containing protein [Puniceicoccaceae bacterium]